jgi:hypothetical protein
LISLSPISVSGGMASVAGSVNAAVATAGSAATKVRVTINGAVVGISAAGTFSAATSVAASGGIVVRADDLSSGSTYTISIPASAIPSNGVAADALAQLDADAVTLMLPPDGFTIVDGLDISASVRVAQLKGIAKLSLNGANLLVQLRAGSSTRSSSSARPSSTKPGSVRPGQKSTPAPAPAHHTAFARVSGKAKTVQVTVTAKNGAKQTTTVPVRRVRSVIRIGKQASISAFGARGIRISAVSFGGRFLGRSRTLGVTVTVRDRRQYLVRDAVVMIQPAGRATIAGSMARMSNRLGRATFGVHVRASALGQRLHLKVVAQTPRSNTHVLVSVSLAGKSAT